ncbi:hypothetical protein ACOSQ2_008555 [Xanthoceras sorbifolium]
MFTYWGVGPGVLQSLQAGLRHKSPMTSVAQRRVSLGYPKKKNEPDGVVHKFTSGDFTNSLSKEIHSMLNEIDRRLQQEVQETTSQHLVLLAALKRLLSEL